jgi:hypothetical protein
VIGGSRSRALHADDAIAGHCVGPKMLRVDLSVGKRRLDPGVLVLA